jgi:hypothetical protein
MVSHRQHVILPQFWRDHWILLNFNSKIGFLSPSSGNKLLMIYNKLLINIFNCVVILNIIIEIHKSIQIYFYNIYQVYK